jgi:tetratricopeptide (TPR) repeat protein
MKLENIEETFESAVKNHKKNNLKIAEKLYKKILSVNPDHFRSIFLLGSLSAQIKNLDSAKQLLKKAIQINSNYAEAHYNLGNVLIELGEKQEAAICYKKAIQINPDNADAHNNLGNLLKESKKDQEAIICYKKAIQINPANADAHNNLGTIFQKSKDLEEAISYYEKAIQLRPNFASAHNNLGLTFHELEEYQKAISSYDKAIEIKPEYAETYSSLGKLFVQLGEFEKAINCFEQATKYESENLISFYTLSQLKKETLGPELKNKIIKIINKNNCTKINLAYGNFLLSIYALQEKNYEKEFDYLLKGHRYYFESNKKEFTNGVDYWLNVLSKTDKLVSLSKLNINIKKENYYIKPIFIVGVPRCGSTLIEKVIASGGKQVSEGEETGIFHSFAKDIINKNKLSILDINILRSKIFEKYNQKGLIQEKNDYTFTDKSLENFFYLDLIKEIFPKAKVIHCKRNTLSSIISIIKNNLVEVPWAHSPEHILEYFNIYHNTIENFKKIFPNFIYELKYEKFANDPEIESKKLLKFCNLPWNNECLKFYKRKKLISKTASNIQIRKAIYKDSINKYLPYKQFINKYGNKYSWFN